MTQFYIDAYPLKAQYKSGEPIEIAVECLNPLDIEVNLSISVLVTKLSEPVGTYTESLLLMPGEEKSAIIAIPPQQVEFEGYGAQVCLRAANRQGKDFADFSGETGLDDAEVGSTAFDVVSGNKKVLRYGFLSDFNEWDLGDCSDVFNMCKLHLNLVQFYDWMYRHDNLVPKTPVFTDLMGREVNYDTVREKISLCHKFGMKAVAYGAIYAASREFFEKHSDWGFYTSSGKVYDFIDIFRIMNISPDSPWHRHIIDQYAKAISEADFDGIHMDTYGFPKTAFSRLDGANNLERLEELFPVLIENTRKKLEKIKFDVCLTFNNVGNWPVDTVAASAQDAIYIEVWDPYERYHHIQEIIRRAKYLGKEKPVILAAYLAPFRDNGTDGIQRAQSAALLLTSTIASNGATHLLLGETNGVLTQGYYVDHSILNNEFAGTIRKYYDFIVRYGKIFYDDAFRDVSMTHCGGENLEYVLLDAQYSLYGEPGKIWAVIREKQDMKVISFINLTGNEEDYWNRGKNKPVTQKDLLIKMQIPKAPKIVYTASPDMDSGNLSRLMYEISDGDRGKVLTVKLPKLHIWSILVAEF